MVATESNNYGIDHGRCRCLSRRALGIVQCPGATRVGEAREAFRARKSTPGSRTDEQSCRLRCLSAWPRISRRLAPRGCDSAISRGSEVGSQFYPRLGISLHCTEPELLVRN